MSSHLESQYSDVSMEEPSPRMQRRQSYKMSHPIKEPGFTAPLTTRSSVGAGAKKFFTNRALMRTHQGAAAGGAERNHPIGAESFEARKASTRGANRLADWVALGGNQERASQVIQ